LPSLALELAPSCRLVASAFPVLRIWRVNQTASEQVERVELDEGADRLLVRRDAGTVGLERADAGTFAWLGALAEGKSLGESVLVAGLADGAFELGTALNLYIGNGTIARVASPGVS